MKVFISWSGKRSKMIAEHFRDWLPEVNHDIRPFFSPEDIPKGSKWAEELLKQLKDTRYGLVVVTPERMEAPWMLFETGAIAKLGDESRAFTLLCGVTPDQVKGPLSVFQHTQFGKDDVRKLVRDLNALRLEALDPVIQDRVFEKCWPDLESAVSGIIETPLTDESPPAPRPTDEMTAEILAIVRGLQRGGGVLPREAEDPVADWALSLASDVMEAPIRVDSTALITCVLFDRAYRDRKVTFNLRLSPNIVPDDKLTASAVAHGVHTDMKDGSDTVYFRVRGVHAGPAEVRIAARSGYWDCIDMVHFDVVGGDAGEGESK